MQKYLIEATIRYVTGTHWFEVKADSPAEALAAFNRNQNRTPVSKDETIEYEFPGIDDVSEA